MRLSDLLRQARSRFFVGRESELSLFGSLLGPNPQQLGGGPGEGAGRVQTRHVVLVQNAGQPHVADLGGPVAGQQDVLRVDAARVRRDTCF